MEENNNIEKLGDIIELLNNSIKNKDMENTLKAFKIIKENKYSLFIKKINNFDKESYNKITLNENNNNNNNQENQ